MRDEPLRVPEDGAAQSEGPGRGDGHHQIEDGGLFGGPGDQPSRHGHQADAAADGERPQQQAQPEPSLPCPGHRPHPAQRIGSARLGGATGPHPLGSGAEDPLSGVRVETTGGGLPGNGAGHSGAGERPCERGRSGAGRVGDRAGRHPDHAVRDGEQGRPVHDQEHRPPRGEPPDRVHDPRLGRRGPAPGAGAGRRRGPHRLRPAGSRARGAARTRTPRLRRPSERRPPRRHRRPGGPAVRSRRRSRRRGEAAAVPTRSAPASAPGTVRPGPYPRSGPDRRSAARIPAGPGAGWTCRPRSGR